MGAVGPIGYVRSLAKYVLAKAATDLFLAALMVMVFYGPSVVLARFGSSTMRNIAMHGKWAALALGALYAVAIVITASIKAVYCVRFDIQSYSRKAVSDVAEAVSQVDNATRD